MKKLSLLLLLTTYTMHCSKPASKKPKSIGTVDRSGMTTDSRGRLVTYGPATPEMLQEKEAITQLKSIITDLWSEVPENQTDPETAAKAQTLYNEITNIFPGYDGKKSIDLTIWGRQHAVVEICSLALNTALSSGALPHSPQSLSSTLQHLKLHSVATRNSRVALNQCYKTCRQFLPELEDLEDIPGIDDTTLE